MSRQITAERWSALRARMDQLNILESDLRETFVRASGSGGQKVNKTSSCVRLVHVPSGEEVRCQESRSQMVNRYLAREALCKQIQTAATRRRAAARHEQEKDRRRNRGLSKGSKRRRIKARKKRSELKKLRRKPTVD